MACIKECVGHFMPSGHNPRERLQMLAGATDVIPQFLGLLRAVGLPHRRLAVRDDGRHIADIPVLQHDTFDKLV